MKPLLEIKDLWVQFENASGMAFAVRGVSLNLRAGETLAIVGESGCGKSVLCRSILGILHSRGHISEGSILFEGQELVRMTQTELNRLRGSGLSMVFQNPAASLNPTYPIGRQIEEAVLVHRKIGRKEARFRALTLLERMGIQQPEKRYRQYPHQLSGGMLQRVVLAAALACGPKLLVADEPTTALDVTIQAQILDLLRDVQRDTGVAILFVSHNLGVVAKIAHRVAVMYAGKIVEIGTAQELFHDPRHPYTWGLLESLPTGSESGELQCIPGTPPDLSFPLRGDAFADRNRFAMKIDYFKEPPFFQISDTHFAATWLVHPDAPKLKAPVRIKEGRVMPNG